MPRGVRIINKEINRAIHAEQQRLEISAIAASSFIQGWLTHFAFAENLPTIPFTSRVSQLLAGEEGRLSGTNQLPTLPPEATRAAERLQQMEVGVDARGNRPQKTTRAKARRKTKMSAAGRKKLSRLMKQRWANGKMGERAKAA